jgi:hypothetical protein
MTGRADMTEAARLAYDAGVSPVEYAEGEVGLLLRVHAWTAAYCTATGTATTVDLTVAGLARRILGLLLNAGWEPPGGLMLPDPREAERPS